MAIPVILDTDIGSDIDDTWALAFMLRCPELDVKLVVTDRGRPEYRAKLACKMLEAAGRTDIPVALGSEWAGNTGQDLQAPCAAGYDLSRYPGRVDPDGLHAMADVVLTSAEPVTVVAIGPMPTLSRALQQAPDIARDARFVGMHGSLRYGHKRDRDRVVAEANVVNDPAACQAVFAAPWDVSITPLDTCGIVQLDGERMARVAKSVDALAVAVMENYRVWWENRCARSGKGDVTMCERESTILFDTVAVYLAFAEDFLGMEDLGVRVTDDGFTRIDGDAKKIRCATEWKDMDAFEELLVTRLTGA